MMSSKTNQMSKARTLSLILALLGLIMSFNAYTQTIPSLFVVVDFMKVDPADNTKYLEVEQNIWKPLHEERIEQGIIVGWFLYAVDFSGSGDEYNYVVINLYDDADNLENPWNAEIPQTVLPEIPVDEILKRTRETRENVKTELFYSIATAPDIPLEVPARYLQVNYMRVDPGQQSAYERIESDIWLPMHNELIETGRTIGWGLWKSLFPRGAGRPYQYLTLNTFSEFSFIFDLDFSIPFQKVHPGDDFAEISSATQGLRTVIRTELWDLVDYAIR